MWLVKALNDIKLYSGLRVYGILFRNTSYTAVDALPDEAFVNESLEIKVNPDAAKALGESLATDGITPGQALVEYSLTFSCPEATELMAAYAVSLCEIEDMEAAKASSDEANRAKVAAVAASRKKVEG